MSFVSGMNIGGLASGLDTNSILAQLVQLERTPIVQLQNRQAQLQKIDTAWTNITAKLSGLRSAIDGIRDAAKFSSFATATSSHADILTAHSSGSPTPGAVRLTVEQLAFAGQRASGTGDTFTALDATMGARELTIHQGDDSWVVNPLSADTTLSEYVEQINRSGAPVRAQAVKIEDGSYRLVLSAKETGAAKDFTLTATNWSDAFATLQAGQDAHVRVGDPVDGLLAKRSSNTITDLVDGVRLQLRSVSATQVTVTTARNVDGAVTAVKRMVDELNAVLKTVKDFSTFDTDKLKAQSLAGDSTARALTGDLLSGISRVIIGAAGDFTAAGSLGISLTRDGALTLDEAVLRKALTDDWDGAVAALGRNGRATDERVRVIASTDATLPGTYGVTVTQAAAVAAVTGAPYTTSAQTLTITAGGKTAEVVTDGTEDLPTLLALINDALDAQGMSALRAEDDGGAVRLADSRYGSAISFTVASDGDAYGLAGTHAGTDVVATVGGQAITGKGQTLTSDSGDTKGLTLRIRATQADVDGAGGSLALGDVTVVQGVAGNLSSIVKRYEGVTGSIQRARDRVKAQTELFQDRIDRLELRVAQRELMLRRQFTAMETAMNHLIQQGNRMAGALAALNAPQQR